MEQIRTKSWGIPPRGPHFCIGKAQTRALSGFAKIFHDFELATNLKLKPKKSILIATVLQLSGWNLDMMRAWLRRAVPH